MKAGDRMEVMEKRCAECLFSNAKIVSDTRRDDILAHCARTGVAFQCHKATIVHRKVVCRGFFDAEASLVVRLAKALGRVAFVKLDTQEADKVL